MALVLDDRIKTGNVTSIWAIRLYYGAEGSSDWTGISTGEYLDGSSNYYYPIIKNKPSIRTSIDLAKSTAKTSDITFTCLQDYLPSKKLSQLLLYGTNNYINRKVVIYQKFTDTTTPSDVIIYTGRLIDISHNHETCTLKIQSARPWDFLELAVDQSSRNQYFPVAYGDFVATNSSSTQYCDNKKLFPIPVDVVYGEEMTTLSLFEQSTTSSGTSSPNPHYYEKNLDLFVPLYETSSDVDDTNTYTYNSGNALTSYYKLKRRFKFKPVSASGDSWGSGSYAIDEPYTDSSSITKANVSHSASDSDTLTCVLPQLSGKLTSIRVDVRYQVGRSTGAGSGSFTLSLKNTTGGFDETITYSAGSSTFDSGIQTDTGGEMIDVYNASGGFDAITIKAESVKTGTIADPLNYYYIYDIRVHTTTEVDLTEDADNSNLQSGLDIIHKVKELYSGGNGYKSTSGSTAITIIPDAHRDVLMRYCGMTTSTPTGYSDLSSARTGWYLRYWVKKPTDVKKVLDRLQYEGCFVFLFDANGDPKYIYNKSSGWVSSESLGNDDISGLNISHIPFSSIITKMNVNYEKHPAKSSYISEDEYSASGSVRADYNIKTKENIQQVKLDALVETPSGGVQDFADYYFQLYGNDVKIFMSGEIVNPAKWGVEVGDIVTFTGLTLKAYNTDLGASNYFMITDLTRSLDSLKFKAREVG